MVLVLVALSSGANAKQPDAESYTKVRGDALDHWLYTPPTNPSRVKHGRPLVVYLHGCTQNNATDPQVAFGTRWNELAAREGAVVAYPLQAAYNMADPTAVEGNGSSCWNWFLDKNFHRGAGEPKLIADLTRTIIANHNVDPSRVYVMGTSAGASLANILATTYPDLFRAAAMFAGCGYAACADATGRLAYDELTTYGLAPIPSVLFQGSGDTLSNVALGTDLLRQQIGTNDWADDGLPNQSVTMTSTELHGDPTALDPGNGNLCVGPHANWPCVAGATGWTSYPYTVDRYANAHGRVMIEAWLIHGLNHNYPNGDYSSTFTDPAGPDITRAAWSFFTAATDR